MSSTKMSQDAEKEEFKKALEKAGVPELLTKSLVSLYEPEDAVNQIKKMGEVLKLLLDAVVGTDKDKQEIEKLQTENTELKAKIAKIFETSADEPMEAEKAAPEAPAEVATTEETPAPAAPEAQ